MSLSMYVNKDHVAEAIRLFKVSTGLASLGAENDSNFVQSYSAQNIQVTEELIQRRVALGSDILTSKLLSEFNEKGLNKRVIITAIQVLKSRGTLKEYQMGKILRRINIILFNRSVCSSTQDTTQQDVPSTSEFQDFNSDHLQYADDDLLEVSNSFEYDWQFNGHRFIGERVSMIYPSGLTAIGTVQKYLPPDGDDEALFHILHDDGDKEDLDGYECFAAMEQYRKNFSTLDSNSPFARHLESKVVTFKRLTKFKLSILIDLSQYLEMEVADSVTKKALSLQILKAYKNCISVDSSLS
eukprot:g3759.t1